MNNKYIKDEKAKEKRFLEEERKRNRFLGFVLIMLLFILPTYNLAQSLPIAYKIKRTIQTVGKS